MDEQAEFFVQKGCRTVSVSGEAEIQTDPNLVTVTLSVGNQHDDLAQAQSATTAGVQKVMAVTQRFQFPAEDVRTEQLNSEKITEIVDEDGVRVSPYANPFGGGSGGGGGGGNAPAPKRRKHDYFKVSLDVTLIIKGALIEQYNEVMQALLASGASISGEQMETTRLGELRHEARAAGARAAPHAARLPRRGRPHRGCASPAPCRHASLPSKTRSGRRRPSPPAWGASRLSPSRPACPSRRGLVPCCRRLSVCAPRHTPRLACIHLSAA